MNRMRARRRKRHQAELFPAEDAATAKPKKPSPTMRKAFNQRRLEMLKAMPERITK